MLLQPVTEAHWLQFNFSHTTERYYRGYSSPGYNTYTSLVSIGCNISKWLYIIGYRSMHKFFLVYKIIYNFIANYVTIRLKISLITHLTFPSM
jgi:hypothetical protein